MDVSEPVGTLDVPVVSVGGPLSAETLRPNMVNAVPFLCFGFSYVLLVPCVNFFFCNCSVFDLITL